MVFPWEKMREAYRRMEENRNIGKIVLKVGD
ncbi:MAG: zinc-binding dehydrogenase [Thermoactinomyces sp.]